jgi:hypothetical protein
MNWHEVIDERSYEMHQVIAEILRRTPEKLQLVTAWIHRRLADPDYSDQAKEALREWLEIFESGGVAGALMALDDRTSEEAKRLRQSSPFAILMPQETRREIFRKYETLRVGTPA